MVRLSVKLCLFGIQNLGSNDNEITRNLFKKFLTFIGVNDLDEIECECK